MRYSGLSFIALALALAGCSKEKIGSGYNVVMAECGDDYGDLGDGGPYIKIVDAGGHQVDPDSLLMSFYPSGRRDIPVSAGGCLRPAGDEENLYIRRSGDDAWYFGNPGQIPGGPVVRLQLDSSADGMRAWIGDLFLRSGESRSPTPHETAIFTDRIHNLMDAGPETVDAWLGSYDSRVALEYKDSDFARTGLNLRELPLLKAEILAALREDGVYGRINEAFRMSRSRIGEIWEASPWAGPGISLPEDKLRTALSRWYTDGGEATEQALTTYFPELYEQSLGAVRKGWNESAFGQVAGVPFPETDFYAGPALRRHLSGLEDHAGYFDREYYQSYTDTLNLRYGKSPYDRIHRISPERLSLLWKESMQVIVATEGGGEDFFGQSFLDDTGEMESAFNRSVFSTVYGVPFGELQTTRHDALLWKYGGESIRLLSEAYFNDLFQVAEQAIGAGWDTSAWFREHGIARDGAVPFFKEALQESLNGADLTAFFNDRLAAARTRVGESYQKYCAHQAVLPWPDVKSDHFRSGFVTELLQASLTNPADGEAVRQSCNTDVAEIRGAFADSLFHHAPGVPRLVLEGSSHEKWAVINYVFTDGAERESFDTLYGRIAGEVEEGWAGTFGGSILPTSEFWPRLFRDAWYGNLSWQSFKEERLRDLVKGHVTATGLLNDAGIDSFVATMTEELAGLEYDAEAHLVKVDERLLEIGNVKTLFNSVFETVFPGQNIRFELLSPDLAGWYEKMGSPDKATVTATVAGLNRFLSSFRGEGVSAANLNGEFTWLILQTLEFCQLRPDGICPFMPYSSPLIDLERALRAVQDVRRRHYSDHSPLPWEEMLWVAEEFGPAWGKPDTAYDEIDFGRKDREEVLAAFLAGVFRQPWSNAYLNELEYFGRKMVEELNYSPAVPTRLASEQVAAAFGVVFSRLPTPAETALVSTWCFLAVVQDLKDLSNCLAPEDSRLLDLHGKYLRGVEAVREKTLFEPIFIESLMARGVGVTAGFNDAGEYQVGEIDGEKLRGTAVALVMIPHFP